jgi:hypothetical protein
MPDISSRALLSKNIGVIANDRPRALHILATGSIKAAKPLGYGQRASLESNGMMTLEEEFVARYP